MSTQAETFTYRLYYSRTGALTYVGHLDMMRLFERSLLRAKLDCAYSKGFNPSIKMVFALPVGVGVEVSYDPLEIEFTKEYEPAFLKEILNSSLVADVRIIDVFMVEKRKKSLMSLVDRATYSFHFQGIGGFVAEIETRDEIIAERFQSGRTVPLDIRPLILSLTSENLDQLTGIFKAGSRANLRPDLFLQGLVAEGKFTDQDALSTRIIREHVYLLDE